MKTWVIGCFFENFLYKSDEFIFNLREWHLYMQGGYFWFSDERFSIRQPLPPTNTRGNARVDHRPVTSGIIHVLKLAGHRTAFTLRAGTVYAPAPRPSIRSVEGSDSWYQIASAVRRGRPKVGLDRLVKCCIAAFALLPFVQTALI